MSTYTKTIKQLAELSLKELVFTYNVDAPDTLQLELTRENYASLPFEPLDRLTVTQNGTVIFSGIVPLGANCAVQATQSETVSIEFVSDYYILENTVYAKLVNGEAVYSRTPVNSETTTLSAVVDSIRGWLGDKLPSKLTCNGSYVVPTPTSNGTAPCSSLLGEALRWVPFGLVYQRYGSQNELRISSHSGPPLFLSPKNGNIVGVSLRPRRDLQVTTCALVGAVHKLWSTKPNGDIRDLGAFVYAVPMPQDAGEQEAAGAGESPASSKMVVKGVPVPKPLTFERSADEYKTTTITGLSDTEKFIKRLLPEYAPLIPFMKAGTCLVNLVDKETLQAELEDEDEDAKAPDNYMSEPEQWENASMYVHTEGSFPASARNSRNVRGLRWCKATLNLVLSVQANVSMPAAIRALCQELMPGRLKQGGNSFYYVRKTLSCNIINRRRRVYDPATNKLCSNDPFYAEEQAPEDERESSQTQLDYIAAMDAYFREASQLQYEGSIEMLHDGSVTPWSITGRLLQIDDMRPEWAGMTCVIRSVTWHYNAQTLSLSVGPRATMGFSEQLERRVIARNKGRNEAEKNVMRYDSRDAERQAEAEEEMSVSPSISAGTDTESSGVWHKPFTLFQREGDEDGTVVLAGGTLQRGSQQWNLDDSEEQYTNGQPNGTPWVLGRPVRLRWKRVGETITFDIYQK